MTGAAASKQFAVLDEAQEAQHVTGGRLILPDPLNAAHARLSAAQPVRTYTLSIDRETLKQAALEGRLCWRAYDRAFRLTGSGQRVTLSGAVLSGVPRRQVLRVAEQYAPQAPELLRLYAADCAELVQEAGKDHAPVIAAAVTAARAWAVSGEADPDAQAAVRGALCDVLTVHDDLQGITAAVRCAVLALHPDPGTAAQGGNFTAHHLGRTLAAAQFQSGNARARVLSDVDRALSLILARYDAGAV